MDSKQLIKYAAIALAAYLVYQQFIATPAQTLQPGPAPAPMPGPQPVSPGPQTQAPPAQTATAQPVTEAALIQWATSEPAATTAPANVVYSIDEWNYYRDKGGLPVIDALTVPGINAGNRSTTKFSASAYWSSMRAAGLAGYTGTGLRGDPAQPQAGMGHIAFADQFSWLM
jgi:hypothetical protein